MARTFLPTSSEHYIALRQGQWVFALAVADVLRLVPWHTAKSASHSDNNLVATMDNVAVRVVRMEEWLNESTPGAPADSRGLLVVHRNMKYALLVDRALDVFHAAQQELVWLGVDSKNNPHGATALCPWSKLTPYLIRGAYPASNLALARLRALGPIHTSGKLLYAGDHLLNGDTELVDQVNAATGYGCTIFGGNMRIATTARRSGSTMRATGTRATDDVVQTVLRSGRDFRGASRAMGRDWAIVYRPIRDSRAEVVGMVATYREVSARVFPLMDLETILRGRRGAPAPSLPPAEAKAESA